MSADRHSRRFSQYLYNRSINVRLSLIPIKLDYPDKVLWTTNSADFMAARIIRGTQGEVV